MVLATDVYISKFRPYCDVTHTHTLAYYPSPFKLLSKSAQGTA